MFNFYYHFIFILTVVYTTTALIFNNQTCDVKDKSAKLLCKITAMAFPQDDGKFSKHACNCLTGFIKKQPALCKAKDYGFSSAPKCGDLYKSKEFAKLNSKDNLALDYLFNVLFKNICTEREDKAVKAALVFYQPGLVSNFLAKLVEKSFEPKMGRLFSGCYKQVIELVSKDEE